MYGVGTTIVPIQNRIIAVNKLSSVGKQELCPNTGYVSLSKNFQP